MWKPSSGPHRPPFDGRSAADWVAQAERYERMAEQFQANAELSGNFRRLAADARERAKRSIP